MNAPYPPTPPPAPYHPCHRPGGRARQGTREFAFTAADWIFIRTILAICITITCPPLGDAVAIVALEIGGLTRVIDSCQQKREPNHSFCAPFPHHLPEESPTLDINVGTLEGTELRLGGEAST